MVVLNGGTEIIGSYQSVSRSYLVFLLYFFLFCLVVLLP